MMTKNRKLPDGQDFELWEDQTKYKRILHVGQKVPHASDANDGSEDRPFLHIQKAAEIAGPGDMVLIHGGEYHETVRPMRGGRSESEMLCFQGKEGENVIITGGEIFSGTYGISEGWSRNVNNTKGDVFQDENAKVFEMILPRDVFVGMNPFSMVNGPLTPWYGSDKSQIFEDRIPPNQQKVFSQRRGMIFCDGKRLVQVLNYFELGEQAGAFFVEDDGLTVHIRMPDDGSPENHVIEYTAREQCFCPMERYTSFIRIENITFQKAGNSFPPPQRGAVSVNCGHHYIIKNCTIKDANGIGIDLGFQSPMRYSDKPRGFHIVSNNLISGCGISGISGVPGSCKIPYLNMQQPAFMVTNNTLVDNCWQDAELLWENAAIKLHHIKNSLVANNFVQNTMHGSGIWTDASCENIAVKENIILDTNSYFFGGIFIEASHKSIEVSDNIVLKSAKHGIYSHNCDSILNTGNIILGCEEKGIQHCAGGTNRIHNGRGHTGFNVKFYKNIISDCKYALLQPTDRGDADYNVYGHFFEGGYLKVGIPELHLDLEAWREFMGWDINGLMVDDLIYLLDLETMRLKLTIQYGQEVIDYTINLKSPLAVQISELFENINRLKI